MKKVLLCLFLLSSFLAQSQNTDNNPWKTVSATPSSINSIEPETLSSKQTFYKLDSASLNKQLQNVTTERANLSRAKTIVHFPNAKGEVKAYRIASAPVLSSSMQAKYPAIKSYIGQSLDDPNEKIRFSTSPFTGLNATVLKKNGSVVTIQKNGTQYHVVDGTSIEKQKQPLKCGTLHPKLEKAQLTEPLQTRSQNNQGSLRTLRLALLLSSDFSQEILTQLNIKSTAPKAEKKRAIIGYLNSLLTTLNSIFERDVALTLQLIDGNEKLIFLEETTYQATSDLNANQKIFDNLIGQDSYDIGHSLVLANNEGVKGWSYVGSVGTSYKAGGFSTLGFNTGLSIFAHEIGHQLGASHTFNNIPGEKNAEETSVEVGKGKTIMSFGQIAPLFFHSVSITQMKNFIQKVPNIKTEATGNAKPVVEAGKDCIIPKQTPFYLEGKATDTNNNTLSYSWEQIDAEMALSPPSSFASKGPLFSWETPSPNPVRFFPNLTTILAGKNQNDSEALAAVKRELNFALIVRDNNSSAGETAQDYIKLTVDENAGPFQITSQNEKTNWYVKEEVLLKWDVADTDKGAVNTPLVDISFSTDGGQTFPIKIASAVPNNGLYKLKVSANLQTTKGRFLIKGHQNAFLDINNADITVRASKFLLTPTKEEQEVCLENTTTTTYEFIYKTYSGFSEKVDFKASGLANAKLQFVPASATQNNTKVKLNITKLSAAAIGKNTIEVVASSEHKSQKQQLSLRVFSNKATPTFLMSPKNKATVAANTTEFTWKSEENAQYYLIEIAKDKSFTDIVLSQRLHTNRLLTSNLQENTTYYWRAKAINPCMQGDFSEIYTFTTTTTHSADTYIPDENFERALIELGYDKGEPDQYVYTKNIADIKELKVDNYGIQDLTGIEDFKNLESLSITNAYATQKLSTVDLSHNKKLRVVNLSRNNLKSLDVTNLTALQILVCHQNNLEQIFLENNLKLTYISCYGNKLSACSLDAIFSTVPQKSEKGEIYIERYHLSNPGAKTCNTEILAATNWKATKCTDNNYTSFTANGTGCSNHAPIAHAGTSQQVTAEEKVTLDASASRDIDGDALSYKWTAPKGISLANKEHSTPYFIAPEVQKQTSYLFTLVVSDQKANSQPTTIKITVVPNKNTITKIGEKEDTTKNPTKIAFNGDTFTIKAESPACPESDGGVISLTNNSRYTFSVTLNNKTKSIRAKETQTFTNLFSGAYPMRCVLQSDTTQKLTDYIIVVPEPKMFSATKQQTKADIRTVQYIVQGATEYNVAINNRSDVIAFADEKAHLITLQLPSKESFVRIAPASSCKGEAYEEVVTFKEELEIYPRVSKDLVYVDGLDSDEVEITLITRNGNTVLRKREVPVAGKCAFDISNLNDNIYFVNVKGNNDLITTYIYKRTF